RQSDRRLQAFALNPPHPVRTDRPIWPPPVSSCRFGPPVRLPKEGRVLSRSDGQRHIADKFQLPQLTPLAWRGVFFGWCRGAPSATCQVARVPAFAVRRIRQRQAKIGYVTDSYTPIIAS